MGEIMKNFTYQAVIFSDQDTGAAVIAVYDLSLFTEGDSVEEAHASMASLLAAHMSYALKNDLPFNDPTPFKQMVKDYPKQLCVLVECKLDDKFNPIK
jgi:predicted RNase H-like HicB family nuclease